MKEIEKIKNRITKRNNKIDLKSEVQMLDNNKKSSLLFKMLMGIMTVYALFISFAVYAKKDANAVLVNSIFDTNISFTKFNSTLNKLINFRIIESNDEELTDMVVSGDVNYLSLGDDYYTSEGNLVVAMGDGVITYVNGKDENYTIIVEYDSGVRATYNEVNEVNVYVNDRVYENDILGSFDDQVNIIFIKDNNKLTYEEVIGII